MTSTSNDGNAQQIREAFDRIERLDEERRALGEDMKDLLNATAETHGLSKAAMRNILRERRKARSEIHAVYSDMDKLRMALRMPDPSLPLDEDGDEPGVREGASEDDGFKSVGAALKTVVSNA